MEIYLAAFETQYCNYQPRLDPDTNLFVTYFYEGKANRALAAP